MEGKRVRQVPGVEDLDAARHGVEPQPVPDEVEEGAARNNVDRDAGRSRHRPDLGHGALPDVRAAGHGVDRGSGGGNADHPVCDRAVDGVEVGGAFIQVVAERHLSRRGERRCGGVRCGTHDDRAVGVLERGERRRWRGLDAGGPQPDDDETGLRHRAGRSQSPRVTSDRRGC